MKADFNNLRKNIVTSVNNLASSIKEHFEDEGEEVPSDIIREFNGLRTQIGWLSGLESGSESAAFDSILDDDFNLEKLDND